MGKYKGFEWNSNGIKVCVKVGSKDGEIFEDEGKFGIVTTVYGKAICWIKF